MNPLILDMNGASGSTVLSNIFIDQYMPKANGSFVKVYLCLLRHVQMQAVPVTLSFVADTLEETEKDIIRALNYWEKNGLMQLTREADGSVTGIRFILPETLLLSEAAAASDSIKRPDFASDIAASSGLSQEPAPSSAIPSQPDSLTEIPPTLAADPAEPPVLPLNFEKPDYSEAQIAQLRETEEVKWMFSVLETYLERLLKPMDIQLILYLYESLGFSAELILYLYEYCVSRNKKSPSYVEAVALSWAREGINTVEKAETAVAAYASGFQSVNKAFGLNRAPGAVEKQYIQKWFGAYGFDSQIVEEACSRTLLATGKPDFKYADKILESWKKEGVAKFADIAACDQKHAKESAQRAQSRPGESSAKPSGNKFNAFPQRSYTGEDFSTLEQRLLNKK